MERRFHAICFIVSRTSLLPELISESRQKTWFRAFTNQANEMELGDDPPPAFIPHVGRLKPNPPCRTYESSQYPEYRYSGINGMPFYVPCKWQIRSAQVPSGATLRLRLRIRIFGHGGVSCTLFGQLLSDNGLNHEQLVTLLRSLVDSDSRAPLVLQCKTAANQFEGTAGDVMERALSFVAEALLEKPDKVSRQTLEPDHVTVDLGKTTPPMTMDDADGELLRVLALTSDMQRRIRHKREPDLGLFDFDWVAASTKQILFCNTNAPWPEERRQRALRRHGRLVWQLYRIAEVARIHLLWCRHLANTFEASSLEMTRAQNLSRNFVENLMKATYYDDRLYTLALDIPAAGLKFYSRDKLLYAHLAKVLGLDKELARLDAAEKHFISQVKAWTPGIMRIVDLIKSAGK